MNYYGCIRSFNVFFRTFVDYFKLQIFVTFLTLTEE